MSRPVIPVLAVLFLGWSSVATAAETPPDADEAEARADVQAKKKKRRKKRGVPLASGGPARPGPEGRAAPRASGQRHAAQRRGAGARAGEARREGGKRAGPAVRGGAAARSGAAAQRAQAGARGPVGRVAGSHRPDVRKVGVPGRSGSAGGPVRRGVEQPKARSLPGERVRTQPDPRAVPQGRGEIPGRAGSGGSWHGAGDSGASNDAGERGGATRGERGGATRGERGGATRGERGGSTRGDRPDRAGGPRTPSPRAVNRAPDATARPRIIRVHRSRYVPERWAPGYHRRGLNDLPKAHPKYWSSGVFLYNPPSRPHRVTVVEQSGSTQTIEKNADKPLRAVDRSGSFAIGLRGGSYVGRGADGERHADNGLGVAARFRLVEALGVEVAWSRHQDSWETEATRTTSPLSVSGQVFAFPWTRVSPYLSGGYTWTNRSVGLQGGSESVKGPHAGLGLELAIGDSAALGLEGRYTHYGQLENIRADLQNAGALQGTLGMNFYF